MRATGVTVSVPVSDLDQAVAWYQRAFELGEPDQIPMEGMVEFNLGAVWLQLDLLPSAALPDISLGDSIDGSGNDGVLVILTVEDARAEHGRFTELGLVVSDIQHYEGVVDFFELTDLYGNSIGFVTELA